MIELLLLVGGAGVIAMVALGAAGVKGALQAGQAQQDRLEALMEQNPDWSNTPLHAPDGHLYNGSRGWSAYGRNQNGVVWELCLNTQGDSSDQLAFRTPELKLERLEFVICDKSDMAKLNELLPNWTECSILFLARWLPRSPTQ